MESGINGNMSDRLFEKIARILARDSTDTGRAGEINEKLHEGAGKVRTGAIYALAGLMLGGATGFGGIVPFGMAFLCAADRYLEVLTVALCIGGLLRQFAFLPAFYAAVLFTRLAVRKWRGGETLVSRLVTAGGAMVLYGVVSIVFTRVSVQNVLAACASAGVCVLSAYCFGSLLCADCGGEAAFETGIFIAVYAAACATRGVMLFGINIGYLCGFIVTLYFAFGGGALRGCAAGLLFGLGTNAVYSPAFAIGGLIAGRLSRKTMIGIGTGTVACMIYASFTQGFTAVKNFLPEIAIGAVLYAPLCKFGILPENGIFSPRDDSAEQDAQADEAENSRAVSERLCAVSDALHSLSAIFYGMSERMNETPSYDSDKDMTKVFASDYASLSTLIKSAAVCEPVPPDRALGARIREALALSDFHCKSVSVTGATQKTVNVRGIGKRCVNMNPEILRRRLSNICGMRFTAPVFTQEDGVYRMCMRSMPQLRVKYATATSTKSGEKISGDSAVCFDGTDGLFYALICDGMGSGKDAAVAARICCIFLQKMLEGGNDAGVALDMLNTFLRSKGYECFATVDLLCVDLFSGKAYFIKGGGAPSYLVREGSLFRLNSASAPVGIIKQVRAEKISFDVRDGDFIVMVSDGADNGEGKFVGEEAIYADDCEKSAHAILDAAHKKFSFRDDITVCTVKIKTAV